MFFCDLGAEAYRFHGNNIEEHGIANGPAESLTSFTVGFWVNITDDSAGAILSYAYECDGDCTNGFLIEMSSGLTLYYFEEPYVKDDHQPRRY